MFGIQHYLYADFVAGLVPGFIPFKLFWVYLTGTAMIAAGVSFIVNRFARLAAALLGVMLLLFIFLIHVPALLNNPPIAAWTRPLQDVALACSCFLLANLFSKPEKSDAAFNLIVNISCYLFAAVLIGFGIQQFFNLDFVTAKVPLYFPIREFWMYLTGILMIGTGISVMISKKAQWTAAGLGLFLLILDLLNHGSLLAGDIHQPILWTAAMLDLAIVGGIFILADTLSAKAAYIK